MSMTSAQQSGWSAGTGGGMEPASLNLLILGLLGAVLFLFVAWVLVTAYRGVSDKSIPMSKLPETAIRLVVLLLLTLFFFFH
ncbi:TIGR03758 family integrating conjugative element protein [Pectobacteriaceae bacterium CE70]|nr:TIGR03758 family integrating conjugative element protein [Pectobacteriaceae bacterium C52]WJV67872.1 TIGR03758 family integrating conjugative element protein [Pectobacteriaceae bacterium CE70]WJY11815.1 TIGR03758 family integrating conjugative element protein [Pectobacteriaceae bacterium C80]